MLARLKCDMPSCKLKTGDVGEILGDMYHDPETGRVRVRFGFATTLVPESYLEPLTGGGE